MRRISLTLIGRTKKCLIFSISDIVSIKEYLCIRQGQEDPIIYVRHDIQLHNDAFAEPSASSTFSQSQPLMEDQVADLIRNSLVKSSALKPILADLFMNYLPKSLPSSTAIINCSHTTGIVSPNLKESHLSPVSMKHNLYPEVLNNYHHISNLRYILKLIECAVANQFMHYLTTNNLREAYQSIYHKSHSTETAITCIFNTF